MAEKRRFLMYFSYIGSGFWGSQYQWCRSTGVVYTTVQNSVEKALQTIFKLEGERPIIIKTCSRTDSGVHALKAAFHVDLPQLHNKFLNPISIKCRLNKYFLKTCCIRILDVIPVSDSFSFKDACLSKTYLYRIGILKEEFYEKKIDRKVSVPIIESQRTFFLFSKTFDLKKAEEAANLFVGEKDFAAVARKPNQSTRNTVCVIFSFTIEKAQPLLPNDYENEKYDYYHFICTGKRFLFHMVRSMVGAVISVGMGRTSLDEIRMLFEKPEPSSWPRKVFVLPTYGLYLADTTLDPQKIIVPDKLNESSSKSLSLKEIQTSAEAA